MTNGSKNPRFDSTIRHSDFVIWLRTSFTARAIGNGPPPRLPVVWCHAHPCLCQRWRTDWRIRRKRFPQQPCRREVFSRQLLLARRDGRLAASHGLSLAGQDATDLVRSAHEADGQNQYGPGADETREATKLARKILAAANGEIKSNDEWFALPTAWFHHSSFVLRHFRKSEDQDQDY